jgi:photosystem II stability/assembly factor-like uncharacterized protein
VGASADGYGTILRTVDGGASWTRQGSPAEIPDTSIQDICAVDADTAWAVGLNDGNFVILRTDNAGTTWRRQGTSLGLSSDLYGISALDGWTAFAAGANGTVLFTDDGGATWTLRNNGVGTSTWFQAVSAVDKAIIWGAGQDSVDSSSSIYRTTDGGTFWSKQNLAAGTPSLGLIDISAVSPHVAFASGVLVVLKTVTGGGLWTEAMSSHVHVNGVFALDTDKVWTALDYGDIYYSTDSGTTWLKPESISTESGHNINGYALMGVHFLKDGYRGWVVGELLTPPFDQGIILRSSDGGKTWTEQDYPGHANLRRVSFANPTPTPTPTPTSTPTPTPAGVTIILSTEQASPGEEVSATGYVPEMPGGPRVDVYMLLRSPLMKIYSVLWNGAYETGITPYVSAVRIPDGGWSGRLFTHKVCDGAARGTYKIGVFIMPAGVAPGEAAPLGYDIKEVLVSDSP